MVFRVQVRSFQEEIRSLMILWLPKHILIVDLETILLEILLSYLIDPQPMILSVVCVKHYEVLLVIRYLYKHCFLLVVKVIEFL